MEESSKDQGNTRNLMGLLEGVAVVPGRRDRDRLVAG